MPEGNETPDPQETAKDRWRKKVERARTRSRLVVYATMANTLAIVLTVLFLPATNPWRYVPLAIAVVLVVISYAQQCHSQGRLDVAREQHETGTTYTDGWADATERCLQMVMQAEGEHMPQILTSWGNDVFRAREMVRLTNDMLHFPRKDAMERMFAVATNKVTPEPLEERLDQMEKEDHDSE